MRKSPNIPLSSLTRLTGENRTLAQKAATEKTAESLRGKAPSDEAKKKNSESHTDKPRTEAQIAASERRRNVPRVFTQAMLDYHESMRGVPQPPNQALLDHYEKMRGVKRPLPPGTAEKISKAHSTPEMKKFHQETSAKIRVKQAKPNKAELKLAAILQTLYPNRFDLTVNTTTLFGKVPDFLDKTKKLVVELFGDYWHGPLVTGWSNLEEETARINYFASYGYSTVIIWERELNDIVLIKKKIDVEN